MNAARNERGLLFGVVALQMGIVGREAMLAALDCWAGDRRRPLDALLVDRGILSPADAALVRAVVDRQLGRTTLAAMPSLLVRGVTGTAPCATVVDDAPARRNGNGNSVLRIGPVGGIDDGDAERTAADDPFATASVALPADRTTGRFRPLRFHARGGLGEVWVALDRELNRDVALKQIRDQYADDPHCHARFLLEAEVTGGLEHPGIVPVYGIGTHADGRPCYAMRFIRGESLKEAIERFHAREVAARRPGPRMLALRGLLRRFLDVCNATAYAHSRGVIHRDIKPSNVMLGPFGETLLVDWGLAKALGRREDDLLPEGEATLAPSSGSSVEATEMGQRLGTPAFMSPEQAAGRLDQVGTASDVYSLGASLYTLLVGRPPFGGDDLAGLLANVEGGIFPRPREVQPWVDAALEAVCLRAMARRPEDRYGSPRALAEDLDRWLADEPVLAWREPATRAARRWVLRHQAAVAALVVAAGAALISAHVYFTHRLVSARGRVEALESAEIRAVPELLADLGDDRALVRGALHGLADPPQPDPRRRLRGALALLPDEPARVESLVSYVNEPQATPDDVLVIRRALREHGHADEAADRIIRQLPRPGEPFGTTDLRACGTLAGLWPEWPGWADYLDPIAARLTHDDPFWISTRAEVYEPIAPRLSEAVRRVYADRSDPEARGLAFALLLEFAIREPNPARAEDLAALVPESDPAHAARLIPHLQSPGVRDRVVAALAPMLAAPARFDDAHAARQGRVAATLARLGAAHLAWPMLRPAEDPGVRAELIAQLGVLAADPVLVADRLAIEPDPEARRALVLALGSFDGAALPAKRRDALAATLLDWYRSEPDPGLHSAIDWLLRRRWGRGGAIDAARREQAGRDPSPDRGWYTNGQDMTFAVVRGPVEFRMGSTRQTDPDRGPDEAIHRRRIDRPFAVAVREVTAVEFAAFLRDRPDLPEHRDPASIREAPTGDCPAGAVTWYDAARFCNWVSAREGIPEGQWCYPEPIGPGMTLPDDHLDRNGYRLPTEAEWEYACRAGTASARPFGGSDRRLAEYAWSLENAGRTMHPVASLKPNDLGLFDVLGNAFEWCDSPYREGPPPAVGDAVPDRPPPAPFSDDVGRVLRGGAFSYSAPDLRSAARTWDRPTTIYSAYGFRLARTLPPPAEGPRHERP